MFGFFMGGGLGLLYWQRFRNLRTRATTARMSDEETDALRLRIAASARGPAKQALNFELIAMENPRRMARAERFALTLALTCIGAAILLLVVSIT